MELLMTGKMNLSGHSCTHNNPNGGPSEWWVKGDMTTGNYSALAWFIETGTGSLYEAPGSTDSIFNCFNHN